MKRLLSYSLGDTPRIMAAARSAINGARDSSTTSSSSLVRHSHYKWSHSRTRVCLCRHQFRASWMLPARREMLTAPKVRGMGQLYRLRSVRRCLGYTRCLGSPVIPFTRRSKVLIVSSNKRSVEASLFGYKYLNEGKFRGNKTPLEMSVISAVI